MAKQPKQMNSIARCLIVAMVLVGCQGNNRVVCINDTSDPERVAAIKRGVSLWEHTGETAATWSCESPDVYINFVDRPDVTWHGRTEWHDTRATNVEMNTTRLLKPAQWSETAAHEYGHTLWLNHVVGDGHSIMYPNSGNCLTHWDIDEFCAVAGCRFDHTDEPVYCLEQRDE